MKARRLHTDAIVAVAVLAFCAGVFALTFAFDTVPAALAVGMGPAAFPRLLLAVMALLALILRRAPGLPRGEPRRTKTLSMQRLAAGACFEARR